MRKVGAVEKYDNYVGNIIDENGTKYLFLKDDTMYDVSKGDYVTFEPEKVEAIFEDKHVARFVKQLKREKY